MSRDRQYSEHAGIVVGDLLKRQRELKNITQLNIANKMGYKNVNFVSQIELSRSQLPILKIPDITAAYQFDPAFSLVFLKFLYPDYWVLFAKLMAVSKKSPLITESEDLDGQIDQLYTKTVKEFRINIGQLLEKKQVT